MTSIRSLIALAVMTSLASVASAQESAPANRADVKADAKTAVKSGATAEGELPGAKSAGSTAAQSNTSREAVKSEAAAAAKSGQTAKGNATTYSGPEKPSQSSSTKSRAEVKAGATSNISAPAGESQTQNTNLPVTPKK